jgi:poly(A) polymerase
MRKPLWYIGNMEKVELTRRLRRKKIVSCTMQLANRKRLNAWLVGGSIRDTALGIRWRDYDMVIRGNARSFASQLSKALGGHFFSLGDQWEEYRIVLPRKRYIDIKQVKGIDEDLAARDFTMNAVAMDLSKGKELYDPHEGLRDIAKCSIKAVSDTIFKDDPIRLLRLFRLASALDFSMARETLFLAKRSVKHIKKAAGERIRAELMLLLEHQNSFQYIRKMDGIGLLAVLFPEIEKGKRIPQRKYRSVNLKDHSLVCYDMMEKIIAEERYRIFHRHEKSFRQFVEKHTPLLKLAALLHDIGKLYTMRRDGSGKVHFWTHEKKGELRLKEEYQHRFCFSKKEVQLLSLLILHHMRAHLLSRETTITDHARYRFVKDGGDAVPGILLVTYADSIASSGKGNAVKDVERTIQELMDYYATSQRVKARKRLITGNDLMKRFHLKPGPVFKTLLDAVEKARMDGMVKNKTEAIAFVEQLLPTIKQQ